MQRHRRDPISRTKNVDREVTAFFNKGTPKAEKGKGKSRNLRIKRDLKSINQMQQSGPYLNHDSNMLAALKKFIRQLEKHEH